MTEKSANYKLILLNKSEHPPRLILFQAEKNDSKPKLIINPGLGGNIQ
jgi:hypothetical protein